ncbi:hypothetical protein CTAM01_00813 [Colletotrichum tamarilloi]|uniref:Uncharacterized protein n=1 Tax=Colletotrichum tamarilloi TaxID=1209934 RepID=A0ABQ9RS90_9PEZI|nr:uncharacterized protein CTAM01_00813 [Colletotrichum tamarilloi]KAK1511883.1 hypothetical protein CTAM01_00813 [Colletotrichum tamarilloi]
MSPDFYRRQSTRDEEQSAAAAAAAAAPDACLIESRRWKCLRSPVRRFMKTGGQTMGAKQTSKLYHERAQLSSLHNAAAQVRLGQGSRELLLLSWTLMTEGGRRGEALLLLYV